MAMSATYLTIDGEIVSETVESVSRDYLADSLGSVVGLIDENEQIVAKREYWPYGETRVESGDWTKSSFGYVGSWGYYDEGLSSFYVRFRILDKDQARWQTVDLLWPNISPYVYARSKPVCAKDPSGLWPWDDCGLITYLQGSCNLWKIASCAMACASTGQIGACFKAPVTCHAVCVCIGVPKGFDTRQACSGFCAKKCGNLGDIGDPCYTLCMAPCLGMKIGPIPDPWGDRWKCY